MLEQRESIRVNPSEDSVVVNQLDQKKMGRIIDISSHGFLLGGRGHYKAGMIFQLELVLGGEQPVNLKVGAECIWSDLQPSGMAFGGFHIIDIAEDDQATLDQIIEQIIKR